MPTHHPVTPDGRYFIVAGRLWRMSNPDLDPAARQALVDRLMRARRAVGAAKKAGDAQAERHARDDVDAAKHALGERDRDGIVRSAGGDGQDVERWLFRHADYLRAAPW